MKKGTSSMITPTMTTQLAKSSHQYLSSNESDDKYLNDGVKLAEAAKKEAVRATNRAILITRLGIMLALVPIFGAIFGFSPHRDYR
jgi:hypothetical protein